MEEDLERQWKEKCERLQSSLQDKHQRELLEMNSEKNLLEDKVKVLENKVLSGVFRCSCYSVCVPYLFLSCRFEPSEIEMFYY